VKVTGARVYKALLDVTGGAWAAETCSRIADALNAELPDDDLVTMEDVEREEKIAEAMNLPQPEPSREPHRTLADDLQDESKRLSLRAIEPKQGHVYSMEEAQKICEQAEKILNPAHPPAHDWADLEAREFYGVVDKPSLWHTADALAALLRRVAERQAGNAPLLREALKKIANLSPLDLQNPASPELWAAKAKDCVRIAKQALAADKGRNRT